MKLISFETLFIVLIFIISLYPKLMFSLSLWFSIIGVFYIFLFLKYFSNLNRYIKLLLFNFWIYFAINPIIHRFFTITTVEQLYSPILTLLFTLFYPLVVLLHIFGFGGVFDHYLSQVFLMDIQIAMYKTPLWFFLFYIFVTLYSVSNKKSFILLNSLFICFNSYLLIFIL